MAAEDALAAAHAGVMDRAAGHLIGQPQPARIQTVKKAGEAFGAGIEFLNPVKQLLSDSTDQQIFTDETIELVPVDGKMPLARILPHVALIDRHPDQMRHHIGQAVVVIAFHPYHLHVALGVGELADVGEELPVLAGQAAKVEVGEDVAQKHQPPKAMRLQYVECILRPA